MRNLTETGGSGEGSPIPTSTLTRIWQNRHGVDVKRFFSSTETTLEVVQPHGYWKFSNAQSGDAAFYADLMRRRGYSGAGKAEFLRAAEEIGPGDLVLDVGCGTGNFSDVCSGTYRGIETNPAAVEDAVRLGRNVHSASLLDEKENSYDVVIALQVLEHVEDPLSFLKACTRCLRPGGRLIIATPDREGVMGYARNEILNYPPHHMSWWSESSLRAIASSCDCEFMHAWHEPLQKQHVRLAISALFSPRRENHFDTSVFRSIVDKALSGLGRVARRHWKEVPFINGHTVMIIARKR
jgi:2-polyprenyl-3-methyl-5-hydroxy-6-metoxy-1,4-benzoquinol methylase